MPFMPGKTIAQPKQPAPKAEPSKGTQQPAAAPEPAPTPVPPLSNRPSAFEEIEAAFDGKDPIGKPDIVAAKEAKMAKDGGKTKEPVKPPTPPQEAPKTDPGAKKDTPSEDDGFLLESEKSAETAAQKAPEPSTDQQPVKAPELRAAYAKAKARVSELEKELNEVKAKPVDEPERKAFTEQISTLTKQLDDATSALKFVAYEQSTEYKEKYENPFVDAWNDGVQQASSLTVSDANGNSRKGTPDDFQAIMSETNDERAANLAQELFGTNAFYLLASRRELQKLNSARTKALSVYKSSLAERTKSEAEATKKAQEAAEQARIQRLTMFKKLNDEAATRYPDLFAPLEGDDEGNKLLEKGYANADLAFSGGNGLTEQQIVQLHSAIRNRSAAFGRLVHRIKQKDAKITELEKTIEELRSSAPGSGEVGRGEKAKKELSIEDELEAAINRRG